MDIKIRLEQPSDYREVEELTRDAFWCCDKENYCDEHYLVHILRKAKEFVPELCLVAELDGKLVGSIVYSKSKIIREHGEEVEVLTFGPLSVLTEYQNMGIGGKLMLASFELAKELGYRGIVIYGHPDFYPKYGFMRGEKFGIASSGGKHYDALMALPLYDGAFDSISGRFHEGEAFHNLDAEKVAEFDMDFPNLAPRPHTPIEVLLSRLAAPARRAIEQEKINDLELFRRYSGKEIASWHGIGENACRIIDETLKKYNQPKKNWSGKF